MADKKGACATWYPSVTGLGYHGAPPRPLDRRLTGARHRDHRGGRPGRVHAPAAAGPAGPHPAPAGHRPARGRARRGGGRGLGDRPGGHDGRLPRRGRDRPPGPASPARRPGRASSRRTSTAATWRSRPPAGPACPRVIFASSNHAVGFTPRAAFPVPDYAFPAPDTYYGVSKAATRERWPRVPPPLRPGRDLRAHPVLRPAAGECAGCCRTGCPRTTPGRSRPA